MARKKKSTKHLKICENSDPAPRPTQVVDKLNGAGAASRKSQRGLAAELASMSRLQELSTRLVQGGDSTSLLLEIIDAAVALSGADLGNLQLFDRHAKALKIVASRGFKKPFLEFFNFVENSEAACGISGITLLVDSGHTMASVTGSYAPGKPLIDLIMGKVKL